MQKTITAYTDDPTVLKRWIEFSLIFNSFSEEDKIQIKSSKMTKFNRNISTIMRILI